MFWPNAPKIKPVGDFVYITPAFDWEGISKQKFIEKWGQLPYEDEDTFVEPIYETNVKTRLDWKI